VNYVYKSFHIKHTIEKTGGTAEYISGKLHHTHAINMKIPMEKFQGMFAHFLKINPISNSG